MLLFDFLNATSVAEIAKICVRVRGYNEWVYPRVRLRNCHVVSTSQAAPRASFRRRLHTTLERSY
jgi:hypothetical protein